MHGFDYFVPNFITHVRSTCIVVTPNLISKVLHVSRVEFADYIGCSHLRIVSEDELMSLFCETPSSWGECQNTPCLGIVKGLRFLNMVMTFVLHPLSHYNSIAEPRARFLLSLLDGFTIDFPSHFILSVIDIYKDMTTHDKLIFPSTITQILHHASISYPESPHFSIMCTIDTVTIKWSKVQLRPKRPWTKTVTPAASSAPSTFARLDTLSDELCQVNICVGRIAQRQATIGGFAASLSPSP